jgi:hypothetical protein
VIGRSHVVGLGLALVEFHDFREPNYLTISGLDRVTDAARATRSRGRIQAAACTAAERGLTPLFTTNMTPYGTVQLRRERRLELSGPPSPPEA